MDSVGLADIQKEEHHCENQGGRNRLLGRFSLQEHSLPIGHMELAYRDGVRARTCLSSKAVSPVSGQTAGIAHSQNLGHNLGQKPSSPPLAKARRAEPKSLCSKAVTFVQEGQQMHRIQHVRLNPISPEKK